MHARVFLLVKYCVFSEFKGFLYFTEILLHLIINNFHIQQGDRGEDNYVLKRRCTNMNPHSKKTNSYMQEAIFFLKD